MLLTAGERISMALLSHGGQRPRRARGVASPGPRPASSPTPTTARPRSSRSRATASARRSPTGKVAIVAGFQGVSTAQRHHHARPGRLRHHRGRARGRARRRRLRDLHRRRRRVHRRPAHRARRAQARPRLVRRDARDGGDRRPGARAALGRVRAQPPRAACTSVRASPGRRAPGSSRRRPVDAMEQAIISGVTHDTSEAKITIEQVPDRPGVAASVFRALADDGVNVDMIVQNVSTAGHTDISFTVPRADLARSRVVHGEDRRRDRGDAAYRTDARSRPGVARRRGHEDAPRCRGQDVRGARRRGRQHRDDQHVDDPDLVRGRTKTDVEPARAARCTRAFGLDGQDVTRAS